ncbi:helix-turn-helix domain-containing protein [Micromonospora sediminimaris]|uniref:Transcriptional regulator n=1 Tax=Micromonospora sediminimaris TaxID=547162 RepID=A0A9W5XHF9_9ACTN|nr:helix-turn-helix domain-containing protein [Micromonospora sediminimaris]GIJ30906.1 transcriptional regulator [Micromonospora sediminimaris]SFC16522.1 Helix-turn-helix domain-containing protein [Micromonospora sediminimaris]
MSLWRVPVDLLAGSRFVISPMTDTVAALKALHSPRHPWQHSWQRPHLGAYQRMLARRPVLPALLAAAFAPRWIADFLTLPPATATPTFAEELAVVAARSDERIRADLRATRPGPLAEVLCQDGLTEQVVHLLDWVWTHTVRPEWPERERRLRADVVARTSRLSAHGWAGLFADLNPGMRWLGDGWLQVNDHPAAPLPLDRAAQLVFVPAHCAKGWVVWDHDRFGMVYPASGILAEVSPPTPNGLDRLIGPNRAAILSQLGTPLSTSHLAALTGLSLGAVGDHLRVLLDAGMVTKRRSGREVLYWHTPRGAVLAAGEPVPADVRVDEDLRPE